MLLETAYKIIAIILHSRLLPIEESLDHEIQRGSRPGRGCMDSIFTIKTAIKKCIEHGLESWELILEIVDETDKVWCPEGASRYLRALHNDFKVKQSMM